MLRCVPIVPIEAVLLEFVAEGVLGEVVLAGAGAVGDGDDVADGVVGVVVVGRAVAGSRGGAGVGVDSFGEVAAEQGGHGRVLPPDSPVVGVRKSVAVVVVNLVRAVEREAVVHEPLVVCVIR